MDKSIGRFARALIRECKVDTAAVIRAMASIGFTGEDVVKALHSDEGDGYPMIGAKPNECIEYAAFFRNMITGKEEQLGRAMATEQLCRNRFKEFARTYLNLGRSDISSAVIKKRSVIEFAGEWEVIGNADC